MGVQALPLASKPHSCKKAFNHEHGWQFNLCALREESYGVVDCVSNCYGVVVMTRALKPFETIQPRSSRLLAKAKNEAFESTASVPAPRKPQWCKDSQINGRIGRRSRTAVFRSHCSVPFYQPHTHTHSPGNSE
eukprot:3967679-Amphidinium_carterae.1